MREYNLRKRREAGVLPQKRSKHTVDCACGGRYTPYNSSIHFKTVKHKRYEASLIPPKRKRGRPRKNPEK